MQNFTPTEGLPGGVIMLELPTIITCCSSVGTCNLIWMVTINLNATKPQNEPQKFNLRCMHTVYFTICVTKSCLPKCQSNEVSWTTRHTVLVVVDFGNANSYASFPRCSKPRISLPTNCMVPPPLLSLCLLMLVRFHHSMKCMAKHESLSLVRTFHARICNGAAASASARKHSASCTLVGGA